MNVGMNWAVYEDRFVAVLLEHGFHRFHAIRVAVAQFPRENPERDAAEWLESEEATEMREDGLW